MKAKLKEMFNPPLKMWTFQVKLEEGSKVNIMVPRTDKKTIRTYLSMKIDTKTGELRRVKVS